MQVPVPTLSSSAARMYRVRCSGLQDIPLTRSSVIVLRVPYSRLVYMFRCLSPRSKIVSIDTLSSLPAKISAATPSAITENPLATEDTEDVDTLSSLPAKISAATPSAITENPLATEDTEDVDTLSSLPAKISAATPSRGRLVQLYPKTTEGLASLEADIAKYGSMAALSRHLVCSPSTLSRHRGSIRSALRKVI
ncbi:hypothetical protein OMCYN_01317 [cyanobiont of Ornithocercus magnificus]|nr:hypothetical protein OMCYN_01317 [cyanobiont of Ornithocercus magnificus]